jgi:hypothetical protein
LRVRLEQLLVRRAMDPSCLMAQPNCPARVETTQLGQITKAPGEWALYVDVAGIWRHVRPLVLRVHDGQRVRLHESFDLYVPPGRPWRVAAFTRECDFGSLGTADGPTHAMSPCPRSSEFGQIEGGDDVPGMIVNRFASAAASLGVHRGRPSRHDTTCPPVNSRGCYELNYVVTRIRDDRTRLRRVVVSANDERRNRWRKDDRTS